MDLYQITVTPKPLLNGTDIYWCVFQKDQDQKSLSMTEYSYCETCSAFTNLSQAWRHSVELSKSPDAKLSPFVSLSAAAAI